MKDEEEQGRSRTFILPPSSFILFRFLVTSVLSATTTKLTKLQTLSRRFLILRSRIVPTLAFTTLKNNVIARHNLPRFLFRPWLFGLVNSQRQKTSSDLRPQIGNHYSRISVIVPAPTVRPPSRIAKRNPFSIAIGVISAISIATLSPGITISTPSGRLATPVTSVVRK